MPDGTEFLAAMKQAALDAVESKKPVNVYFGIVTSTNPLKINVEQKMILGKEQLVLARNVTDYIVPVSVDWETQKEETTHTHKVKGKDSGGDDIDLESEENTVKHTHDIHGKKEMIIHSSLEKGEQVILIRQQEGQKYVVIDRLGG